MANTQPAPTKLLWIDLEMTGLDPIEDVILEVAAEITDFNFTTLATYEAMVKQPKEVVVERMRKNTWWADFPENRDEFINKLDAGKDEKQVESELIKFVGDNFGDEPAVIAGNSIHNDRNFIKSKWPELDLKLFYRMLDVSSLDLLMQGKFGVNYEKKKAHRAFDDIQASIAELQYYLEWFKSNN
ncbi:MAG TPA: oligoribonuclease [Candidatus Sulfotelmatobacter sp.]|nr:oligoribonuclease [Candidatus Sulfotelmatobacter sp.]